MSCYMSSDDSASDSEAEEGEQREGDDEAEETTVKRKKFLTKKLPWRSTELEDLVKSLAESPLEEGLLKQRL